MITTRDFVKRLAVACGLGWVVGAARAVVVKGDCVCSITPWSAAREHGRIVGSQVWFTPHMMERLTVVMPADSDKLGDMCMLEEMGPGEPYRIIQVGSHTWTGGDHV